MCANIATTLLVLALAGWLTCGQVCGQIELGKSSFSIRSTISRYEGEKPDWIDVEESYSREQRRARIDYRIKLSDDVFRLIPKAAASIRFSGSFVYDATRRAGILLDRVCTRISAEDIESTLGVYIPRDDEEGIDDHIVGTARLLFFIDKHRNKMALEDNTMKLTFKIRNVPSLMYSYEYRDRRISKDVKLHVMYSEISLALDKDKAIPTQVMITIDGETTLVDFWKPELIPQNIEEHWLRFDRYDEHARVDQFAYKLALGCSEALQENKDNLFASSDSNDTKQFSFRARIESFSILQTSNSNPIEELFVAYDKALNLIRIDSLNSGSTDVYNLNLNRAYHLRDERSQVTSDGDGKLQPSSNSGLECLVSKIYNTKEPFVNIRYSLASILLGSEEFVYIGRGQVDGIDALVYEANDATLPFWLDHEVLYFEGAKANMRNPMAGNIEALWPKIIDLVAYFDDKDGQHRLLMLNINYLDSKRTKMFGKITIRTDDFVWKIDNQSPTGVETSEIFSLADDCSNGGGRNRYGQVSLLLESNYSVIQADSELDIVGVREMALLASFQDQYRLPATMIYDLETRVRNYKNPLSIFDGGLEKTQIHVSFRVAKHSETLLKLWYTGERDGNIRPGMEGVESVRSFEQCFIGAASRNEGPDFGYLARDSLCVFGEAALELESRSQSDIVRQPTVKSDKIEMYKIERTTQNEFSSLTQDEDKPRFMKQLQTLNLPGVDKSRAKSPFVIKAINFNHMDRQSPSAWTIDDAERGGDALEAEFENSRRAGLIEGMGIVQERNSRRVGIGDDQVAINEERCHAACLADADCRAYSVCLNNLETSCIISGLNFTDSLMREIIALKFKEDELGHKIAKKLSLELSTSNQNDQGQQEKHTLELTKHPNCRIRLKKYLDLFKKPFNRYELISKGRIYAVDDLDKCAEMVTMRNIRTLKNDTKKLPDVLSLLSATDNSDQQVFDQETLHETTMRTLSEGFYYFNKDVYLALSGDYRRFITRQMNELDGLTDSDSVVGFCFIIGQPSEDEKRAMEKIGALDVETMNMHLSYEYYSFKFEIFYEKHHGIRLSASPMSVVEQQAFKKFTKNAQSAPRRSESDNSIVKAFLDRHENIQITLPVDLSTCARMCFSQERGPWPACRSFDYILYKSQSTTQIIGMCFLNSLTLKQAFSYQRNDLVDDRDNDISLAVHYEPKSGFVADEIELSYDVSMLASLVQNLQDSIRIKALGIFCIVVLSIFGGTALGIMAAIRYTNLKELEQKRREETLVQPKVVEFDNQVDWEGNVRVH